ncbi:hypothetical protein Pint_13682 [Pistacia integerrima]|uniref:Uncharacterized protein n=1 Tax=Pistacia integerrima TaxID=434235 RepID=A0ACC0YBI3_9ROSI|nr:hypothetical protein Pint_13682 [Pistacia integerrima]
MVKKSERHCDFYNNDGHTKETCFKLHGYPDWYKDLKEQKGKTQHKTYASMSDTPLEVEKELGNTGTEWGTTISELIQQELAKLMKAKALVDGFTIDFAHFLTL